jgi:hypothetical protein
VSSVSISPTPTPEEAAAIVAAVRTLIEAGRHAATTDVRPAAYRSAWRRAAILEGAGMAPDLMRSR